MRGSLDEVQLEIELGEARLAIAPVLAATGVITKVQRVIAGGLPIIATGAAVAGYPWPSASRAAAPLAAMSLDRFSSAIIEAYTNASAWIALADAQRNYLRWLAAQQFGRRDAAAVVDGVVAT